MEGDMTIKTIANDKGNPPGKRADDLGIALGGNQKRPPFTFKVKSEGEEPFLLSFS